MDPGDYRKSEVADSVNEFISSVGPKILIDKQMVKSTVSTGRHLIIMNDGFDFFRVLIIHQNNPKIEFSDDGCVFGVNV